MLDSDEVEMVHAHGKERVTGRAVDDATNLSWSAMCRPSVAARVVGREGGLIGLCA